MNGFLDAGQYENRQSNESCSFVMIINMPFPLIFEFTMCYKTKSMKWMTLLSI